MNLLPTDPNLYVIIYESKFVGYLRIFSKIILITNLLRFLILKRIFLFLILIITIILLLIILILLLTILLLLLLLIIKISSIIKISKNDIIIIINLYN